MRRNWLTLVIACLSQGLLAIPSAAQQSLGVGPVSGASFERFVSPTDGPVAFGYRRSRLTGRGPAEDIAIRLFPAALEAGVAVLGADVGLMQAVAVGPVALCIRGGGSVLAGLAPRGADFIPGLAYGAGLIVRLEKRAALRLDITRHTYFKTGETYSVWGFGLGLAVLPHAARNRPQ